MRRSARERASARMFLFSGMRCGISSVPRWGQSWNRSHVRMCPPPPFPKIGEDRPGSWQSDLGEGTWAPPLCEIWLRRRQRPEMDPARTLTSPTLGGTGTTGRRCLWGVNCRAVTPVAAMSSQSMPERLRERPGTPKHEHHRGVNQRIFIFIYKKI
jgi:hypothetical protein